MTLLAGNGSTPTDPAAPSSHRVFGTSIIVFAGMIILALAAASAWRITNRSGVVQVEQYLVLVYASWRTATTVHDKRPQYVRMIMWMFVYCVFGIVQIYQLSISDNPFHVAANDTSVATALAILLTGCVAFDLSRIIRLPDAPSTPRVLSIRRIRVLGWATVAASPFMVARLGGLGTLFSSRYDNALQLSGGNGLTVPPVTVLVLVAFANVSPFVCLYALFQLRRAKAWSIRSKPGTAVLVIFLAALVFVFDNPISQPRYWIATVVIAVALGGNWVRRTGFQLAFVAAFIVSTLIIFPYLDLFRNANVGQATVDSSPVLSLYQNKTDYGTAQDLINTVTYVDQYGHTDGRQIAGAFLFWVPRSIWPGKPSDTSALLANSINFPNKNIDSPLWAEGYIDGGIAGSFVLLGLFGCVVTRLDRRFSGGFEAHQLASVLAPLLAGYELIILRGSLLQAMGRLAVIAVVCIFISSRVRPGTDSKHA